MNFSPYITSCQPSFCCTSANTSWIDGRGVLPNIQPLTSLKFLIIPKIQIHGYFPFFSNNEHPNYLRNIDQAPAIIPLRPPCFVSLSLVFNLKIWEFLRSKYVARTTSHTSFAVGRNKYVFPFEASIELINQVVTKEFSDFQVCHIRFIYSGFFVSPVR